MRIINVIFCPKLLRQFEQPSLLHEQVKDERRETRDEGQASKKRKFRREAEAMVRGVVFSEGHGLQLLQWEHCGINVKEEGRAAVLRVVQ